MSDENKPEWLRSVMNRTHNDRAVALKALRESPLNSIYDFNAVSIAQPTVLSSVEERLVDTLASHVDMLHMAAKNPKARTKKSSDNMAFSLDDLLADEPAHFKAEEQFFAVIWKLLEDDLKQKVTKYCDPALLKWGKFVVQPESAKASEFIEFLSAQSVKGKMNPSSFGNLDQRIEDIVLAIVDDIDTRLRTACKAPDMRVR